MIVGIIALLIGAAGATTFFLLQPLDTLSPSSPPVSTNPLDDRIIPPEDPTADWETYDGFYYTFKYPPLFNPGNGDILTYNSPYVNTGQGGGIAYLSSTLSDSSIEDVIESNPGIETNEKVSQIGNRAVILTGYTGIARTVYFKMLITEKNGQTVTINLSTPDDDVEPEIDEFFDQILSTFDFIE